jgi:hypothetical protein
VSKTPIIGIGDEQDVYVGLGMASATGLGAKENGLKDTARVKGTQSDQKRLNRFLFIGEEQFNKP